MKRKYNKIDDNVVEDFYDPPIVHEKSEMTIYDAWRSKKITTEEYQRWLKDGYPRNLPIKIK